MQNFIDNLIFPAPKCNYSSESMKGKLMYIPKFKEYYQIQSDEKDYDQI